MNTTTLAVAQDEAFSILRSLLHIDENEKRPPKVLNTIRAAAVAILRLSPSSTTAPTVARTTPTRSPATPPVAKAPAVAAAPAQADSDPTAHLSNDKLIELVTYLPSASLHAKTDRHRARLKRHLARYSLALTPQTIDAIIARAETLKPSTARPAASP